ncbi:MAG: hypothetical protein GWM98_25385, partial [Nitrospinaceae bacterium]|nr:hypothetical protein [Nitrospinaceae bacterium]NIR57197.1 hypothetical protein [Nitrospinaceae bacterium]NIS87640.1 hypothetical protein [Nitrospinaceae bacterium]NIT84507.1 hypothetical protein [Nitrospinaceae bacterium]NIU46697.1 hypothetical protein [Nitrospinaceae bacterium]
LEALKVRYQRGLKPQDLDWAMTQHRTFWKGFMKRGLKDFSWLLTSVKAEQIEHLRGELKQSNREWVRQSQMTEEELQTHTLNQVLRVLEDWLGPLDPKQVDQLRAWIRPDAEWVSVKLENRRHYQKELVSLIQSHKAPEALGDRLRDWIDHPHTIRLPQYNTGLKEKQAEWKTLLLRIDRISFARQKAHFAEKLQDLIDDFRDLTNERPWFKI